MPADTPQSFPTFIPTQDKQSDNQGLFRFAPLTLNIPHSLQPLSIKTCCSNTHLLYPPQICFSSCVQQVGVIPSALWNLTLKWKRNKSPWWGSRVLEQDSVTSNQAHTLLLFCQTRHHHTCLGQYFLARQYDSSQCPWQTRGMSSTLVEIWPTQGIIHSAPQSNQTQSNFPESVSERGHDDCQRVLKYCVFNLS